MHLPKRLLVSAGLAASISSLGLVGTAHASEAPQTAPVAVSPNAIGDCPGTSFCGWSNTDYTGTLWYWVYSHYPHDEYLPLPSGEKDQYSSVFNNREYGTYVAPSYPPTTGNVVCLYGGAFEPNLGNLTWPDGGSQNNSISSLALLTYACPTIDVAS